MAEGRFLSRNIAFSEQLGQVSMEADYLFSRMIPHLDCEGRLTGSAKSIRARVCPLREEMADVVVQAALAELDQARLIVWYEVDGVQCVEYPNFEKYQTGLRKEREAPSKVPASSALGAVRVRTLTALPEQPAASLRTNSGVIPENSGHSKVREVKVREVKSSASGAAERGNWVDDFLTDYTQATEGTLTHGELGRALKSLINAHGVEIVRPRWRIFILHEDVRFGPPYFAKHFGKYKPESGVVGAGGNEDEIRRYLAVGV